MATSGKDGGKSEFQRILDDAERHFGQKQDLAEAIGITPSRYSKLYGGDDYSLSAVNCLRLAEASHRHPSEVLRAAGKGEIADLIERLYGISPPTPEQAAAQRLVSRWMALPTLARDSLMASLEAFEALVRGTSGSVGEPPVGNHEANPGTSHGRPRRRRQG